MKKTKQNPKGPGWVKVPAVTSIRFIVDNFHVSAPDSEIINEIPKRARPTKDSTPTGFKKSLRGAIHLALRVHHENQRLYRWVMQGEGT